MKLIPKSAYKIMPWKNGGGVTAEIDRFPSGDGPFFWRLSQAEIQSAGPFSSFPGYDRLLCVIKGGTIILGDTRLEPLVPFSFSGDQSQHCRLTSGPVSDLGLIFDRQKFTATMSIVEGSIKLPDSGVNFFFDLQTGDTFKTDQASEVAVPKSIWVSIMRQNSF